MLKKLLIVLLFAVGLLAKAENLKLSPNSKVVVFTCTKGDELYAGFGHNAIWVSDPETGVDRLYNYGTFDFETPNFYVKFIRGKLDYMLSVTTVRRFLNEYNYRKIGVTGQDINLTDSEKQAVYDFLENNYLPENRFYKYDFFYDNCATRIRDVIFKETNGKAIINAEDPNRSFREMLFPYMTHTPWTKFGINIILGLSADKKASNWDCMYLPELMQNVFNQTTIETPGEKRNLVKDEVQYLKSTIDFSNRTYDDPIFVFGIILAALIILSIVEHKKKIRIKLVDNLLFSISSIAGLFLLFMWIGTDHSATNYNLNILWLLPAQALFLVVSNMKRSTNNRIIVLALIYQLVVSVVMFLWPQNAELSFFLISIAYGIRILSYYIKNKKAI